MKVSALVVGLSGFYLLFKFRHCSLFFSQSYIMLPAVFALASAAFLLVSGCIGLGLTTRESSFLQGLFVYLLVVVFCLESTASVLAYFHSGQLDSNLAPLGGVFNKYTGSSEDPTSHSVDATQEEFQCCGVHGYRDWVKTTWFNHSGGHGVPHSCCDHTIHSCNATLDQPWQLYPEGCQMKLKETFMFVLSVISWSSLLVLLVEILGFLAVGQLMRDEGFSRYDKMEKKSRHGYRILNYTVFF
ncbi:tetraspanin 37 isoform X2 [Genypterus blacodes]|uniref:tetraspanin 37 isoform X2 n=1 Tax=Genypterus blacodes TaxID=154954 RepID=UPI003F7774CE